MYPEPDEFEDPQTAAEAAGEIMPDDEAPKAPEAEAASESEMIESAEALPETQPEPGVGAAPESEMTEPAEAQPEASAQDEPAEVGASELEMTESADELAETRAETSPQRGLGAGAIPQPALEGSDEPSPDQPAWYVVHCYSGYENKVRHNLEQRIETMGMKDKIFDVVIPTQEEIEVKEGKRRTVERHIFPGYVLVNMILTEESWYVVRNTPGVTGFVGMGTNPTPLRPEEVNQIIKRMEAEAPRVKVSFKEGERVRIIDGPFNDFRGTVAEIDMERTKVRVMVSMFGRDTPVELDFLQVEKA
jgi:transcriptional antiterminator NusG